MIDHLVNDSGHRKEMISQILMRYPDDYPLCVIEPCCEYIGLNDYDRLVHLEGHTVGLVAAWLECLSCGGFTLKNPNDIKKRLSADKNRTHLDEFFWS